MNYFNYFTEIEETFVRRRGKHLLLSPMDWALIESWKKMGVPLHVALRGVESSFDSHGLRPRKRAVKSLLYCQEEVEAQFAEWQERQQGAPVLPIESKESSIHNGNAAQEDAKQADEDRQLPFTRLAILAHLKDCHQIVAQQAEPRNASGELPEAFARAATRLAELIEDFTRAARPDAEGLEAALSDLETLLDEAMLRSASATSLAAKQGAADEQLQPYRARMEQNVYEQTRRNLVLQRLRAECNVPRLSLFYL